MSEETRDLTCYFRDDRPPNVRPAPAERQWMDETPMKFAYRCLPLSMANAHGWEVLNETPLEVVWDGGQSVDAVKIRPLAGSKPGDFERLPTSNFGSGILTFHVGGLLRTPPDWNLWVSGSPNYFKDGAVPLTGLVETDWSVMTFTMNWKLTRPGVAVRFDRDEPICFFFPVRRGDVESFSPRFDTINSDPELAMRHADWGQSRSAFLDKMRRDNPENSGDRWQKHYFQGTDVDGRRGAETHQTKIKLKPFAGGER